MRKKEKNRDLTEKNLAKPYDGGARDFCCGYHGVICWCSVSLCFVCFVFLSDLFALTYAYVAVLWRYVGMHVWRKRERERGRVDSGTPVAFVGFVLLNEYECSFFFCRVDLPIDIVGGSNVCFEYRCYNVPYAFICPLWWDVRDDPPGWCLCCDMVLP